MGPDQLREAYLAVGRSTTETGEGRTIPLNSVLYEALSAYSEWYTQRFGEIRPEWYVFPFRKPSPNDPTRPVPTLKTAGRTCARRLTSLRWHDKRHTLVTALAESGASDQTIMDIAGHISKQMLKHYSPIRMEARRTALESIVHSQPAKPAEPAQKDSPLPAVKQLIEGEYPRRPHSRSNRAGFTEGRRSVSR
jgi:integrase